MSFMFNPSPYNDNSAVNRPVVSAETTNSIVTGAGAISKYIAGIMMKRDQCIFAIEGYPSASFLQLVNLCSGILAQSNIDYEIINAADYYKAPEELEKQFTPNLPLDRGKDPVLLFGKRLNGGYETIYDENLYKVLVNKLQAIKEFGKKVAILYGFGCTFSDELQKYIDYVAYLDLAPKEAVLRAKSGNMINIGDKKARPFKEMMRRAYYIDFEIALHLRRKLLHNGKIDFYIDSTIQNECKLVPKKALDEIMSSLSTMPFRCRPVYIEGVWGGQYVKSLRRIPDSVKNIAWSFEFIPMEVSVVVEIGENMLEFPFYTFLQKEENAILGQKCVDKFSGYFPIRFNYDDTFHSSGNMSIQVHSGGDYNKENYNEICRQDESYYIVVAGNGAKTYLGFNDGMNPKNFIKEAKRSEKEHTLIDYLQYINSVDSKPGVQVMIPAGTIHASGRNQVILEIGSLTVGSYTYKMYDYLRLDLDGVPRPIHTYHGENVLRTERNASWVSENIVQKPREARSGDGWRELILGEHDLLYFSLRQLEFETEVNDDTNGQFHVLTLVDGEKVMVQSLENPGHCYYQNYMDIVIVPANMGRYKIKNLGNQPIIIHKTMLKEGYENEPI